MEESFFAYIDPLFLEESIYNNIVYLSQENIPKRLSLEIKYNHDLMQK